MVGSLNIGTDHAGRAGKAEWMPAASGGRPLKWGRPSRQAPERVSACATCAACFGVSVEVGW